MDCHRPNIWRTVSLFLLLRATFSGFSTVEGAGAFGRRLINNKLEAKLSSQGCSYPHKVLYFEQQVDHFGFSNTDTFQMRYLLTDDYWKEAKGPIFFYAGNEGDINMFCENTGFMFDIAPSFQAMVVFAEHRYYGKSLPYGNDSYKDLAHTGYLSSEQALADYAVFLTHLKATTPGAADVPVVAFGGSYGGMLAAWMRMKYPSIIAGAIAASAPVWQFQGLTPCYTQYRTISQDFRSISQQCYDSVHTSWDVINNMGKTESGRAILTKSLRLCSPLKTITDVQTLISWITDSWFNLAMVDYPYETNFLEPLPAFPVKVVCSKFKTPSPTDNVLLEELASGLGVYYNSTGNTPCFNLSQTDTGSLGDLGWSFQFCSEMVMPYCADGVNDMFYPMPWDYKAYVAGCLATWNLIPRPDWIATQYGGKNISAASNIYFSNGLLDPWHEGGVLTNLTDTLVAGIIPDGAHHLDLRGANKDDPPSVRYIRKQEMENINRWIAQWWRQKA